MKHCIQSLRGIVTYISRSCGLSFLSSSFSSLIFDDDIVIVSLNTGDNGKYKRIDSMTDLHAYGFDLNYIDVYVYFLTCDYVDYFLHLSKNRIEKSI